MTSPPRRASSPTDLVGSPPPDDASRSTALRPPSSIDPSRRSALDSHSVDEPGPRATKWFSRSLEPPSSPQAHSRDGLPSDAAAEASLPEKNRKSSRRARSRSIGSLDMLSNTLSPSSAGSPDSTGSTNARPVTSPTLSTSRGDDVGHFGDSIRPVLTNRTTSSSSSSSTPSPGPTDGDSKKLYVRSGSSNVPLLEGGSADAAAPPPPRRGSQASTISSETSSLRNLAAALKPSRGSASSSSKNRDAVRKRSGRKNDATKAVQHETLDEWADARFDAGDEEGVKISAEMVRAASRGSGLSTSPSTSTSTSAQSALGGSSRDGGGKSGGKFLRRTRSKLGLLGKGGGGKDEVGPIVPISIPSPSADPESRTGSGHEQEDGASVRSPVMTIVEPPSPSEPRHLARSEQFRTPIAPASPTNSVFHHRAAPAADGRGTGESPATTTPTMTTTTTTTTGNRIGGWFSSMLHSSTSSMHLPVPSSPSSTTASTAALSPSPTSSPEKVSSRGGGRSSPQSILSSSSTATSPSKKSTSHVPLSTSSGSRLGPLDRMLDKAVQYFLDTDSNVDRCQDDIWVLGVRHEGWRAETAEGVGNVNGAEHGSHLEAGGSGGRGTRPATGKQPTGGGRSWSPVKSRATKRQQASTLPQQQVQQRSRDSTTSSRTSSPSRSSVSLAASSVEDPFSASATVLSPDGSPSSSVTSPSLATPVLTNGWPTSFYVDFYSRPALTYRTNFPGIPASPAQNGGTASSSSGGGGGASAMHGMLNTLGMSIGRGARNSQRGDGGLTSDTGWGCMLRTGQSLLANALVTAHLGREWRRSPPQQSTSGQGSQTDLTSAEGTSSSYATYARLLSLFLDTSSPSSPFSIHRFALEGQRLGKSVGEWFGPSTAAGAIRKLVNEFDPVGIKVVSCVDGTLYENEVVAASTKSAGWDTAVLVLFNLRLGIDGVNPIYHDAVKGIFRFPQSVGIAGGRPSSSYYFVGAQADSLFYIDPHHPRPAVYAVPVPIEVEAAARQVAFSPASPPSTATGGSAVPDRDLLDTFFTTAYDDSAWRTYHCDKVRKCSLSSLDPSMLVGFLIRGQEDWDDFKLRVRDLGEASTPIFSLAPAPPKWMRRSSSAVQTLSTTAARQPSSSLASPGDDSFSELDEGSVSHRLSGIDGTRDGDASELDDEFSEPEDWELQSTDASVASSTRGDDADERDPSPLEQNWERDVDAEVSPTETAEAVAAGPGAPSASSLDAPSSSFDAGDDDDSEPVFVESHTSPPSPDRSPCPVPGRSDTEDEWQGVDRVGKQ
ncbi:hypothetical protein JCM10212_005304 [Sporobolomyces blumeae]